MRETGRRGNPPRWLGGKAAPAARRTDSLAFSFGQNEPNTADEDCPVGNGKSASPGRILHARPFRDLEIDTT